MGEIMESKVMMLRAWFINKLQTEPKLQAHHFDTLRTYFKGLGLREIEVPEKYEEALQHFFGKTAGK
jgi:hypothetical protein